MNADSDHNQPSKFVGIDDEVSSEDVNIPLDQLANKLKFNLNTSMCYVLSFKESYNEPSNMKQNKA